METYVALSACIGRESESVAKAVGKDVSLVRKWKEDPVDGSGARNPLDIVVTIMVTALRIGRPVEDVTAVIRCLEECVKPFISTATIHDAHSDVMREVSHLLMEHAAAVRDNRISPDERHRLHRESQHVRTVLDEYDRSIEVATEV
jgi:hypothetical protein